MLARVLRSLFSRRADEALGHYHAALAAQREQRPGDAVASLKRAIDAAPGEAAYPLTLGSLLLDGGRADAAIPWLEHGAELARGTPLHVDALTDLGAAYAAHGRGPDAEIAFQQALAIDAGHESALRAYADLLYQRSDTEPARAIARPGDTAARLRRALMLPVIVESRGAISAVRERFERELDELLAAPLDPQPSPETSIGMTAFYLSYHGLNDRPLLQKLAHVIRRCYPAAAGDLPRRPARKRRRVGFVSTYFQSHSIGRTTLGWIRDLPRDAFEVYVVSIAPRPGDRRADEIRRAADHYVEVPATLEAARAALADAELDFLIFADIGMHPLTYYLAFWRMAPVQLAAWGHPSTTGIDTVDYFISSESLELPGSDVQYGERLLKLGGYFMPRYARPALDAVPDRASFGLPTDGHLYGCPQTLFKLHPDYDDALAALLERDPAATILTIEANPHWARKLRERFVRAGGDGSRLLFLPQQSSEGFLRLLASCDVLLDPFHFGGNNSSMEGLALGVPIVTLPAAFLRGRFTLGHYQEMDYRDCVADSAASFVDIAFRLASEPDARESARQTILQRCPALFDRADAGVCLGRALEAL